MRVLIFGDSITHGGWDVEKGGWANRLRLFWDTKELQTGKEQPTVFNLGIGGEVSGELVQRIENEAEARGWPGDAQFFVIAVGTNNTSKKNGKHLSSIDEYISDIEKISSIVKKRKSKVLFVGMISVDDERCNPVPWGSGTRIYQNDYIWDYEKELRSFCMSNDLPVVELFEDFKKSNEKESLLEDGVHPNAKGHQWMFERIKPEIEKLIK